MEHIIKALAAALEPYLVDLLVTVIIAALGVITPYVFMVLRTIRQRTGLDVEAMMREALHKALASGAAAGLDVSASEDEAVRRAVEHATRSVPDAIRKLKPDPKTLETLARAKVKDTIRAGLAKR